MRLSLSAALAAVAMFCATQSAKADTFNFDLNVYGSEEVFSLTSANTPVRTTANELYYDNVSVLVDGIAKVFTVGFANYSNYSEIGLSDTTTLQLTDGSVSAYSSILYAAYFASGAVFTGQTASPSFNLGIAKGTGSPGATLDISSGTTAATPEPSSLALLGTGILGVVGAARRRLARA